MENKDMIILIAILSVILSVFMIIMAGITSYQTIKRYIKDKNIKDEIKHVTERLESAYETKFRHISSWEDESGNKFMRFKNTDEIEAICHIDEDIIEDNFLYNFYKKDIEEYIQKYIDDSFKGTKVKWFYEPKSFSTLKDSSKGIPTFKDFLENKNVSIDLEVAVTGNLDGFDEQTNKIKSIIGKGAKFNIEIDYLEDIRDNYTFEEYRMDKESGIKIKKTASIYNNDGEAVVNFYEPEKLEEVDIHEWAWAYEKTQKYLEYLKNKYNKEFEIVKMTRDKKYNDKTYVKCKEFDNIIAQVDGYEGFYYDNFLYELYKDSIEKKINDYMNEEHLGKIFVGENGYFKSCVVMYETGISRAGTDAYGNENKDMTLDDFIENDDISHNIKVILTGYIDEEQEEEYKKWDKLHDVMYGLGRYINAGFGKKYRIEVTVVNKDEHLVKESVKEILIKHTYHDEDIIDTWEDEDGNTSYTVNYAGAEVIIIK